MKTLQTIQELCVSVVDKEATKVAMKKKGFSLEEKKNIANSFKCLLSKTELRAALRFILRCMDEEWELASEAAMDSVKSVIGSLLIVSTIPWLIFSCT